MKENKNFVKGSRKENNYKFYPSGKSGIYKIYHDKTGHFYIGSTSDIGRRLSHHFGHLKRGTHHCARLQKLFNNSIYEDFSFDVIEVEGKDARAKLELESIEKNHNNPLLLNTSTLNNSWIGERNVELTKQWVEKISDAGKKRTGEKNPFYKKKHTKESLEKISKSQLGKENLNCRKKVVINGVLFDSYTEASEKLNVNMATINHRVNSNERIFSNWYDYDGTVEIRDKDAVFEPSLKVKSIYRIEGKIYINSEDIKRDYNVKSTTLSYRVKSDNFPNWEKL